MDRNISVFRNSLVWFGAGLSIAEILAGILIAPLGFQLAIKAILLGHVIGVLLLFMAGSIAGRFHKDSLQIVQYLFGTKGARIISVINAFQLIIWTSVMISCATLALVSITHKEDLKFLWCMLLGILVIIWIISDFNILSVNIIARLALLSLAIIILFIAMKKPVDINGKIIGNISFYLGIEISALLPISWVHLISDYTYNSDKPIFSCILGSINYFISSFFMYMIGVIMAFMARSGYIKDVFLRSSLTMFGLMVIVISTVTTTFFEIYSAGINVVYIKKKIKEKYVSIFITLLSVCVSILVPIYYYKDFLLFIGAVTLPILSIMFTDFTILRLDFSGKKYNIVNIILWLLGIFLYYFLIYSGLNMIYMLVVFFAIVVVSLLVKGIIVLILRGGNRLSQK